VLNTINQTKPKRRKKPSTSYQYLSMTKPTFKQKKNIFIISQTKAAFTRTYNKEVHLTPYSTGIVTKKKRGGAAAVDNDMYGDEEEAPPSSDEEGEKIDLDTMIKVRL
jgi:hypothetical protein